MRPVLKLKHPRAKPAPKPAPAPKPKPKPKPAPAPKPKKPKGPPPPVAPGEPGAAAYRRYVQLRAAEVWLREAAPVLADPSKPLALSTRDQINALPRPEGVVMPAVRTLLWRHTGKAVYLRALAAPGSMRHDLQGRPVEPVSAEHRAAASGMCTGTLKTAANQ